MRIPRLWLRSVPGQLALLGGAYLGAVVLAVLALCLRSAFFERYIGETYRAPSERVAALLRDAAGAAPMPAQLRRLDEEDPGVLYEAWMADPEMDPQGRLARRLLAQHGRPLLERVRRTLALGTPAQRARALDLLGHVEAAGLRPEAIQLCRHELRRSQRRGESDLAERARRALAHLADD